LIVVSGLPLQQTIEIPAGWSGISSYVVPQNAGIEDIFGMYTGNIEIIIGDGGIYFPAQGVNTIGNWDAQSGYLIKMTDNTPVTFAGFDAASKTISVGTGWSVIPVTGTCPANTDTLFDEHPEVIAVKEAAGTGIYWPAKGINTLTNLMPGKAYYILTTQEFTFTYPECSDGYQLIWSDDFN
jgi:hypothetical protein